MTCLVASLMPRQRAARKPRMEQAKVIYEAMQPLLPALYGNRVPPMVWEPATVGIPSSQDLVAWQLKRTAYSSQAYDGPCKLCDELSKGSDKASTTHPLNASQLLQSKALRTQAKHMMGHTNCVLESKTLHAAAKRFTLEAVQQMAAEGVHELSQASHNHDPLLCLSQSLPHGYDEVATWGMPELKGETLRWGMPKVK
eukprot:1154227-Pelagomonas_calceolata.AAC.1